MKSMKDKRTFIDSNILLYLFDSDLKKKNFVTGLLTLGYTINTQVVNENVNVCLRKLKFSKEEAYSHGTNIMGIFNIVQIYPATIAYAYKISINYQLGFWDSLIVSTAIESKCKVLFSEDLNDGQIIEGTLQITNPFKLI